MAWPNFFRRDVLQKLPDQRCFYLFITLLVLVAVAPFMNTTPSGVFIANLADTSIMLAAVAAVGRSRWSFLVVLLLAVPTVVLRWLSIESASSGYFYLSLKLHVVIYLVALALLLRYTFDRKVISADRLWGAAAAYLMIGVLWCYVYAIANRLIPRSFAIRGELASLEFSDMLYFSFSTLTTTGFGDIVPMTHLGRSMAILESVAGQLFIAILIAKLVSVYPRPARKSAAKVQRKPDKSKARSA